MSDGFVVVVEFSVGAEGRARFLDLVRANAAASVRDEPGCRRFDVLVPPQDGPVMLYEIYDSPAAFDAHLATAHFILFRDAVRELGATSVVRRYALHEHAKSSG
jgi:quinol monooxygenase YgiN